jgi:hypothetical protein
MTMKDHRMILNDEQYGEKRRDGIIAGAICGGHVLHLSNVSPCFLQTVLQVAEYGTVPASPFSLLPFVSYRCTSKNKFQEIK